MNRFGELRGRARNHLRTLGAGYLARDPLALLQLRPGRVAPYAIYARMRAQGPLLPASTGGWVTASHRVCDAVLRDRRFGTRSPRYDESTGALRDLSLLGMNPPDHTRLRRLVQPAFSPKLMTGFTDRIERTVDGLVKRASGLGRFDLMTEIAMPLPFSVITGLLGIAGPDVERLMPKSPGGEIRALRHLLEAGDARAYELLRDLFERRRREPRDDLISRLVAAEGEGIDSAEMVPLCGFLLVAGMETTVYLIGNALLALLDRPEQWELLCADPARWAPAAVEEALRFDPPVQLTSRTALEPVELAGVPLSAGMRVLTLFGAANRDPEVWDRPDEFDLCRPAAAEHLGFASGIHYCAGRPLALLEATIALRTLAERMPGLVRNGPVRRRNSTTMRGPLTLPVRIGGAVRTARRGAGGVPAAPEVPGPGCPASRLGGRSS
ncbi:cytochrome P450 [Amycolatopsis sp. NBC_00345]|uniref:cytochrome P450 n=1 Tax=Amycolatopsis sp. NBC_00345 TaxID=2975955 RepID=UPI002E276A54